MIHLNTVLLFTFLVASFVQPSYAVLDHRAQTWKPQQIVGSAQLSISEINTIVLPETDSKSLTAAINDLSGLLKERYGQAPALVSEGHPKNALYFQLLADGREGGAFTIQRERTRVIIKGTDEAAWCNALYTIMEDLLGARWYWAGDLGFEWVEPSRNYFVNRPWRESPAFVQRRLYPVKTDFARRNRLNSVYSFNHNLAKVFSKELFETKPEIFAEVNGRRKQPRGHGGTDPQPDFTEPEAVEIAAQSALDYFEKNPERTSFSLSINDNVLFDTTERTKEAVSPLRYFRGRPDYTDLVFGFMNRVAERVFDQGGAWQTPTGEDRYLTALSYYWTEPAPTIQIHPHVMPVLTSDRAQWHDPDYRAQDKELIQAWMDSGAERVATWDYYFGAPYPYPRQFNQWIAESLRYMSDAGVDVFFSQLPSFWGLDGAKAWLAAELLWNPEQNAEALLDEYYTNFFGVAAEPIRAFYETAERYRNEHEGQADWIKLYKDESNIALFTPEVLQQMRGLLDEAEAKVGVPPLGGQGAESDRLRVFTGYARSKKAGLQPAQDALRFQARVQVVSEAFRLTENYAALDQSRQALVVACFDEMPAEVVQTKLSTYRETRTAYFAYFESYLGKGKGEYAPERRVMTLWQSDPEPLALALLSKESSEFSSSSTDPLLTHRGKAERNFLGPELPRLHGWHLDYRPSEHFSVTASDQSIKGDAGVRFEGADIVSLFRTFPVFYNVDYELRMRAAWKISLDNRVHLHMSWLDRDGNRLKSVMPLRLPIEQRDQPVLIRLPFTAPDKARELRVRIVVSRQYPGDYLDISELDLGLLR